MVRSSFGRDQLEVRSKNTAILGAAIFSLSGMQVKQRTCPGACLWGDVPLET